MTFRDVMKKSILPMALLAVWGWLAWQFCESLDQTELEVVDDYWFSVWNTQDACVGGSDKL